MALQFVDGWNQERQQYVDRYGQYKAFLDTLTEQSIRDAFEEAHGHFNDQWAARFIDLAIDQNGQVVKIEQGSHQAEDMPNDGFCLHFTGRDPDGYAFHFYIQQRNDGTPFIFRITYRDGGQTISDNRN